MNLCECGCGGETKLAKCSHAARGHVKGEPLRFIHSHNSRIKAGPDPQIVTPALLKSRTTEDDNGCWVWNGRSPSRIYATIRHAGRAQMAHRVSYELHVGPIPEGLTIDHLCRNTFCVNPDHLEPVTVRENILRGYGASAQNARKTHCIHGHAFDEKNTGLYNGERYCRTCQREYMARRRAHERAAA